MKHSDAVIGKRFRCGGASWQITDVGTRTVIAIMMKDDWTRGPPYAMAETVFNEDDLPGCELEAA